MKDLSKKIAESIDTAGEVGPDILREVARAIKKDPVPFVFMALVGFFSARVLVSVVRPQGPKEAIALAALTSMVVPPIAAKLYELSFVTPEKKEDMIWARLSKSLSQG